MKIIILLFSLLLSISALAQTNTTDQPTLEDIFAVKETFIYEVQYGFFKLGWVEVSLLPDTMYDGKMHKHLFTKIESNPKIPFMSKEIDHFHSLFYENEDGLPVTSYYWRDNVDENKYKDIIYSFDRENGVVTYLEEDNTRDTLQLEEPATAGHIIFYFSRLFAGGEIENRMPVYVTKKKGAIQFKNPSKVEKRKYEAFDKPINAYLTTGSTENIEGPFGFSGEFRAWFLDDDLRVPLEARVKVLIGNAIVKLIEYKREEL